MMTQKEMHDEFWLLTKSILQDSRIDTEEARVLKRWLEEHQQDGSAVPTAKLEPGSTRPFDFAIEKLTRFLADGYVDRFESAELIDVLGHTLRKLNAPPAETK